MLDHQTAKDLIRPHMLVICADDVELATVGRLVGLSTIELADQSGAHHYIPLTWVTSVDDNVHIDRTGERALHEWSSQPPSRAGQP
jgi:hypothetical protein